MQVSRSPLAQQARGTRHAVGTCSQQLASMGSRCSNKLQLCSKLAKPCPSTSRQRWVVVCAKRASKRASKQAQQQAPIGGSGWRFEDTGRSFRITMADTQVEVARANAWQLGLPLLGLLGVITVLGPLVIGVTVAGVALSIALSVGALGMTWLLLPLLLIPLFMFSSFAFGMVTLSLGLILPKIAWLAATAGLGFLATKTFLVPSKAGASTDSASSVSVSSGDEELWQDTAPDSLKNWRQRAEAAAPPPRDPEILAELAQFDEMLADRDAERRSGERWKSGL